VYWWFFLVSGQRDLADVPILATPEPILGISTAAGAPPIA
jgi:hypothetical protein